MNEHTEPSATTDSEPMPTQAQLYDDLRRIGQLEDQKQAIQAEIDEKTERLRSALPALAQDSLLYQMLASALKHKSAPTRQTASGRPPKKKKAKAKTAGQKK